MPRPQSALLPDSSPHARFLTLLVGPTEEDAAKVRTACARLPLLTDEVGADDPAADLLSAVGFGSDAWDRLFASSRPAKLRPFAALEGPGGTAPSTPADVFLHIRCERHDFNFELARRMQSDLRDSVTVVEEVHGFRYMDGRDLTGFVDGTENPAGEHRAEIALVGDEEAELAGGSYVSIQRYIHDLASWERLAVAEQERIIARTKKDDVEFATEDKPLTAHIRRVSIKDGGRSLEILRHSMPYGTTSEHGLYFVAYCNTPDNFDRMLASMIMGDQAGHFDHLMRYTRAVTGASFFVPCRDWLERAAG